MTRKQFIENAQEEKAEILKEIKWAFESAKKYPVLSDDCLIDCRDNTDVTLVTLEQAIEDLKELHKKLSKLSCIQEDLECDLDEYEWDKE